jgi:hypothetical protein
MLVATAIAIDTYLLLIVAFPICGSAPWSRALLKEAMNGQVRGPVRDPVRDKRNSRVHLPKRARFG